MESPAAHQWFLRKHDDGGIFGPVTFEQLVRWASSAQVAPNDSVSTDQENWMKAPMLPELGMDWIAEVTSERLYGPTTLGAIVEFIRLGDIDEDTFVINSSDGTRQQVREIAPLLAAATALEQSSLIHPDAAEMGPSAAGISIAVQERIADLEQALREERRALARKEERYAELERKYHELVNAAAASGS
ncbi:MAG: DUF4339 domain-containing protein [Verrucomicrobiota bacterium]|nr:DUF4339 domain-containing protein [Verrucomicrobiota bacterium]